tara:strand:+ start:3216 stop:4130 length:915 start_codon:yes stop_codon:yes gene_type:complete
MSLFRKIQNLKTQILEIEKVLQLVGEHPLMSQGLLEKLSILQDKLKELPKDSIQPKISLLFSGNAVKGSLGIKSNFLSKTIKPFQDLVKTQTALVRFGNVGKRGKTRKSFNSELYLTALPTGSFGIELSQLETTDLFDEQDVASAIHQIMNLIDLTSKSDEEFEEIVEITPNRSLNNLRLFLKEISEEHSVLKMESGSYGLEISEERVKLAFDRVDSTSNEENEVFIEGILRGILLDSGRFEISSEIGNISGLINEELSEEQLIEFDQNFLNKTCRIHMKTQVITFKTGKEKVKYELINIEQTD